MSYYNQGPGYPPQGPGYPPQGPPPPQQPYGQGWNQGPPPNQGYQQQGWNQPPPQQGYSPPAGNYPPPGQYNQGPPPPNPQWGQGPPPGHFQQGPPPAAQHGPPAQPTLGYGQMPDISQQPDVRRHASDLRNAMKGFGTNEEALIKVLARLDAVQVHAVKLAFQHDFHRDLMKDVHSETSGYFRDGLEAIIRGPLDQDCHALHESIKGIGTKESAMNDVLLSRSNADMNAIKQRYRQLYHTGVEADVKGDLSMKTERMFDMVMSARRAEESAPVIPQQIDADVQELYHATEGKTGTDQISVCQVLTSRSNGQLRAIGIAYKQKFHRSLDDVIKKEFSGHMEDALLYILRAAEDPAKHDADVLEDCMRGAGTKDAALVRRIIAIHWNKDRLQQCKAAYKHFHKQELAHRIRGETRGDYEKLMVACVEPQQHW